MQKSIRQLYNLLTLRERLIAISLLLATLFASILEVGALGALVPLIAVLGHPEPTSVHPIVAFGHDLLGNPDRDSFAILGLLGIAGLFLIKSIYLAGVFFFAERFNWNVSARFSNDLILRYVNLTYIDFQKRDPNEMVTRLTGEFRRNVTNSLGAIITISGDFLFLLGVVAILIKTDPIIAGGGLSAIAGAATIFYFLVQKKSLLWGLIAKDGEYQRLRNARYSIMGFKELILLNKKPFFVGKYISANNQTARALGNSSYVEKLARPWLESIAVLGLVGLALAFIKSGRSFDTLLPIMVLVAATGLRSLPAINRILTAFQRIKRASPFIQIAHDEFSVNLQINQNDNLGSKEHPSIFKSLVVRNLSFGYNVNTNKKLLDAINLEIHAGQSVGIIGESGSGKSTLMDLMLGLIAFDDGYINVNGQSVSINTEAWQRQVGYLSQRVFIFEGTLRENIAIGISSNDVDAEALDTAIRAAQLHEFISSLPGGLETRIGEAGSRLSGGQQQRVGIARLLYRNPDIMFMDEPTASLDNQTSKELWETLQSWGHNKTMVVISHDESMLQDCDVIYKINNGQVSCDKGKS